MEDRNCFAVTNQHSSAVYVRSAEFPLFEMEIRVLSAPLARVCRVRVGDHVHRRRTSVPYGRVTADAPVTRRPPRTVHTRDVGSRPVARAAYYGTILKIAQVFTYTRSLIHSDCVLLRNTRWGTAIAIG